MGEFAAFVFIVFAAFWGSAVLYTALRAIHRKQDAALPGSGTDQQIVAAVREELETMSRRLERMEEEMDFFRQLHAPDDKARLGGGGGRPGEPTPGPDEASG